MTNGVLVDARRIEDIWRQVLVYFTIGTRRLGRILPPTIGAIRKLRDIFEMTVDSRIREVGFAESWEQKKEGEKYVLRRASEIGMLAASLAEAAGAGAITEDHVQEASLRVATWARKVMARNQRRQDAAEVVAGTGNTDLEQEPTYSAVPLISHPTAGNLDTEGGVSLFAIQPPDAPTFQATTLLWCEDLE